MDEIKLPRHVLNRFERRWTARFAQMKGTRTFYANPAQHTGAQTRQALNRSGRMLTQTVQRRGS